MTRSERDGAILLELHVAADDLGKVIGRAGGSRGPCARSSARAARRRTSAASSRLSTIEAWITVGPQVGRPHGIDGEFVVEDASESTEALRPARASTSIASR